jgi:hypothetical protein
MYPGVSPWKGKKKPVMLVNVVVSKKIPFQPSRRFPAIIPNKAMNPVKMPMRLNGT